MASALKKTLPNSQTMSLPRLPRGMLQPIPEEGVSAVLGTILEHLQA